MMMVVMTWVRLLGRLKSLFSFLCMGTYGNGYDVATEIGVG